MIGLWIVGKETNSIFDLCFNLLPFFIFFNSGWPATPFFYLGLFYLRRTDVALGLLEESFSFAAIFYGLS